MKRILLLLAGLLLIGATGCSNEGERGKNKDLDKPKSADKNK